MKTSSKVKHVSPYYPPSLGGMQNCARIIAEKLSVRGYDIEVITSDIGFKHGEAMEENTVQVNYLKSVEVAHTPISLGLLPKLFQIGSDSLVHLHIANAYFPELVYLVSRIKKFKYIAHFHIDVEASGKGGFLLPLYKSVLLERVLKNAAAVICLTSGFKKLLIEKYGVESNKIKVIPNGVGDSFYVKRHNIDDEPYKVLFVGRLAKQKNLVTLLQSFSNLKINAVLNIVGEGEERFFLESIVEKFNIKNVYFHGRKEGEELVRFYREADIFVMTSINEGMSLAILEAMATGIPIIASDISQMRELIGNGGLFINTNEDQAVTQAMFSLLHDIELRKRMSALNNRNAKKYSWNKSIDMIESLYKKVWI